MKKQLSPSMGRPKAFKRPREDDIPRTPATLILTVIECGHYDFSQLNGTETVIISHTCFTFGASRPVLHPTVIQRLVNAGVSSIKLDGIDLRGSTLSGTINRLKVFSATSCDSISYDLLYPLLQTGMSELSLVGSSMAQATQVRFPNQFGAFGILNCDNFRCVHFSFFERVFNTTVDSLNLSRQSLDGVCLDTCYSGHITEATLSHMLFVQPHVSLLSTLESLGVHILNIRDSPFGIGREFHFSLNSSVKVVDMSLEIAYFEYNPTPKFIQNTLNCTSVTHVNLSNINLHNVSYRILGPKTLCLKGCSGIHADLLQAITSSGSRLVFDWNPDN